MFSFYINASLTTIKFKLIASTKSFVFPGTLPHVSQIKKKKFKPVEFLPIVTIDY
jgi:hypothetical protein